MIIQLKKRIVKPTVLECIREDGSSTWSKLHQGTVSHDIAHYAVETVLGFTKAFYGIIASGFNIDDFELPKNERPEALKPSQLDASALQTEHIVNLLQVEFFNSGENQDFIAELTTILSENHIPFPENLNSKTLKSIRTLFSNLLQQWNSLDEGEFLELSFPE